jgi:fructuronate reductase
VYTADAGDLSPGGPRWEICGVAMRSPRVVDAMRSSRGAYELVVRGPVSDASRSVSIHTELLVAVLDADAVVARIAAPDTAIVTLTITEGGYVADNPILALLAPRSRRPRRSCGGAAVRQRPGERARAALARRRG